MSRNRFTGITARILMLAAAGVQVLTYLSVFVNPSKVWLMTVFGLFFIPVSLLNAVLLVWALKRKSKAFLIPLMALLPSVFFVGKYVQFSEPDEDLRKAGSSDRNEMIRIVSYNVGRFSSSSDIDGWQDCADSVAVFLKSCDADIICLQEVRFRNTASLKAFLASEFKGYKAEYYMNIGSGGCFGNVTLSRFRAVDKGVVSFEKSTNMALYTDYATANGDMRIYNCHLESYAFSLPKFVKSIRNHDREFFRKTEEKVKMSISRRPKQADMILKDIASSPVEAFVCGDFNDNPMSYTYFRLSRDRSDSFVEAGSGFGATYSFLWPMLRIDYILYPERFRAVMHKTLKVRYSDHYPIVADIII